MHPKVPTVTSIAPSMLCNVIGNARNGLYVAPNMGKRKRSLHSHNKPPMSRKPSSRMSRSAWRTPLLLSLLNGCLSRPTALVDLLADSDNTKPNRKCSSMSSSKTIGCKKRKSRKTTAKSRKPGKTTLLSNKTALTIIQIFFSIAFIFPFRIDSTFYTS